MPAGTECYESMKIEEYNTECQTPCKGVYADVEKNVNLKKVESMSDFEEVFNNYIDYKSGNRNEAEFKKEIAGIHIFIISMDHHQVMLDIQNISRIIQ